MGARPTPPNPPSVPDLLSAATTSLSPWLPEKAPPPRSTPRELRQVASTLARLRAALTLASTTDSPLFDRVAAADARLALSELRDIAARARAASAARPRIPAPAPPPVLRAAPADRDRADAPPFPPDDRRRVEAVANRLDGLVQVALWKGRSSFATASDATDHITAALARCPSARDSRRPRVVPRKGAAWRGRLGRKGRVLSAGDMPVAPLLAAATASRSRPTTPQLAGLDDVAPRASRQPSAHRTPVSPAIDAPPPPWHFSPIESPITPLRSRSLAAAEDGAPVMAMWRGKRVSVRIVRHDESAFVRDADFLYSVGQCPNVPTLLGAHWESAPRTKKKTSTPDPSTDVGYLILEVVNGASLDKLVRDAKINDTVTIVRVLERVVATLVFAQKVAPSGTHQDIHPGNILLVPADDDMVARPDAATIFLADPSTPTVTASDAATTATATTTTATSPTTTTPTDAPPAVSQSSLPNPSSAADPAAFTLRPPPDSSAPSPPSVVPPPLDPTAVTDDPTVGEPVAAPATTASMPEGSPPSLPMPAPRDIRIPKVEELSEALTVLQRVALHDSIDSATRKEQAALNNAAPRPPSLPMPDPMTPLSSPTPGDRLTPPPPPTPDASRSEHAGSASLSLLTATTPPRAAAYTVMVMDFPSALEAEGARAMSSWHTNDALSGYCPPERATPAMWRVMQQRREKERERRLMAARSSSSGRSSPRPSPRRRSAGSGAGAASEAYAIATARSSTSSQRRPFDSETYALFGDDHLVDIPEPDIDSSGAEADQAAAAAAAALDENLYSRKERHGGRAQRQPPRSISVSSAATPGASVDDTSEVKTSSHASDMSDKDGGRMNSSDGDRGAKMDVWSVGWLLYYMCTGRHPPRDAWARRCGVSERELRDVPADCRDIVRVCVEPDTGRRACLRDVKRRVDSLLQRLMFAKGIALLDTEQTAAFLLLDKAVGMRWSDDVSAQDLGDTSEKPGARFSSTSGIDTMDEWIGLRKSHGVVGCNAKTRMALSALPLVVVRRVEWEAAARYFHRSDAEMRRLRRALVRDKWNKTDVRDGASAVRYLSRHADDGVIAAQSAFGWVLRWGAGGVGKDVPRAMRLWEGAAAAGDAEACNGLGLLFHHGRDGDVAVDGKRARALYQRAVDEGYPAAAVNLGVMLHDGARGVPADGVGARRLYDTAVSAGDAVAANNLGLLLQHGGVGVEPDAEAAVAAYELAIRRGERHHACRNLAELLWDGAGSVSRSRSNAVAYFEMAIQRGDTTSRAVAIARLRSLLRSGAEQSGSEDKMSNGLIDKCRRLVGDGLSSS